MLCMILVILYALLDYSYNWRSNCSYTSQLVTYFVTADMTKISLREALCYGTQVLRSGINGFFLHCRTLL